MVVEALLRMNHSQLLGDSRLPKPIVSPQGSCKEPNALEFDSIVIHEHDGSAYCLILECATQLAVIVSVRFVIAHDVQDGHWPIRE